MWATPILSSTSNTETRQLPRVRPYDMDIVQPWVFTLPNRPSKEVWNWGDLRLPCRLVTFNLQAQCRYYCAWMNITFLNTLQNYWKLKISDQSMTIPTALDRNHIIHVFKFFQMKDISRCHQITMTHNNTEQGRQG